MGGEFQMSCIPMHGNFISLKRRIKKLINGKHCIIKKRYDNNQKKYLLGKKLGRGHFGITYLCTNKEIEEVFACKSISKKRLSVELMGIEDVEHEVAIMCHLPKHPNIVSLKSAFKDENDVHLVMELCEGGELLNRIPKKGHCMEQETATFIRTIVEVIHILNKHGIMHRDLKLENFMFANRRDDSPLKVIDFGLSVFFKPGEKFNDIIGTFTYMAPEVWEKNYGPEADVWSVGVIMYILLCGRFPFDANSIRGIEYQVLFGHLDLESDPWPNVSESAKSLMRHMLDRNPKTRYNAQQLLNHPWLQNVKNNSINS